MLRPYDQLGLLKPCHINGFTGYRFYVTTQLSDLNRVFLNMNDWQHHKYLSKDWVQLTSFKYKNHLT